MIRFYYFCYYIKVLILLIHLNHLKLLLLLLFMRTRRKYSFSNIVKGDIIYIRMKERVLADLNIFIIEGDLQFDNSPLTGEYIAITATKEAGEKDKEDTLEATNLVFFSTNCKKRREIDVCIKIVSDTEKNCWLTSDASSGETTLQKEINNFIFWISCFYLSLIVIFLYSSFIGYYIITDVIFSLGIVVINGHKDLVSLLLLYLLLL